MKLLHRDYETRSVADLREVGAYQYASHPSTEVLCCAYAVDSGDVKLWTPGVPVPEEFKEAARNPNWLVAAHNDQFERLIEQHILAPHYGWPLVPLERHRCTLASAHAQALPGELELLAIALRTNNQKDTEGHRVMQRLSKPRRPRKDEDANSIYWDENPEKLTRLYQYCKQDVRVEREVHERIGFLPEAQQEEWLLDAAINHRGIYTDAALLENAISLAEEAKAAIHSAMAELTAGGVTSFNQYEKLKAWLCKGGCATSNLQKETLKQKLTRADLSPEAKKAIQLRLDGAQAAANKLPKMKAWRGPDGRIRGALTYHGASTGRWSSKGIQAHNLKKAKTIDLLAAIDAVTAGDVQQFLQRFPTPLAVIGDLGRAVIAAAEGHLLIAGDFSAIESRVLAWLAGEHWKLDTYRKYDETGNPKYELYCLMASQALRRHVTPEDEASRNVGKVYELSFGFGGGLGAWRKFDNSDAYSDAEVEGFKQAYRRNHPATVRFWRGLERAVHYCIATRQPHKFNRFSFEMNGETLLLTLPSARRLSYPEARLAPGKFEGTRELQYKDNANGLWVDCSVWYGKIVENVVQATARDIMAAAMLRLEQAGYPVILTVHDEIVCEVPDNFGSENEFHQILIASPEWAQGLPIAAKARTGKRFAKIKAPSTVRTAA
jgi:DNA polymerase